jgi:hypothetical protein
VGDLLGHASITSTQIYTHLNLEKLKTKQNAIMGISIESTNEPKDDGMNIRDGLIEVVKPINNAPESSYKKESKELDDKYTNSNVVKNNWKEEKQTTHDLNISATQTPIINKESEKQEDKDFYESKSKDPIVSSGDTINYDEDESKDKEENYNDIANDTAFDLLVESQTQQD